MTWKAQSGTKVQYRHRTLMAWQALSRKSFFTHSRHRITPKNQSAATMQGTSARLRQMTKSSAVIHQLVMFILPPRSPVVNFPPDPACSLSHFRLSHSPILLSKTCQKLF
jgi:hypothetical protein